ncbi:MAG: molybdate ABC transporter substrate-binding protein [Propionibacterium sp.]|nr:MAG: molybdate ABC transporter substrate-binding protein [Propionibacterium sp.]
MKAKAKTEHLEPSDIIVSDVSAAIGGNVVVTGVNFEIPAGAKVALVGTNGAGKSTLLRTLAGISPAAAGEVKIGDRPINDIRPKDRARLISFVGQEEMPPAELRVAEMVALGRIPHRPPWAVDGWSERRIVTKALKTVGLADFGQRPCDHLSGGERRRAMIARGIAQECPILMLDEPTNHLDIAWQLRLLSLFNRQEGTVIAAIHDIDMALRHFDLVAVLHDRKLWAFGEPIDVLTADLMADAFGVEARQVLDPITNDPHLLVSKGKEKQEL